MTRHIIAAFAFLFIYHHHKVASDVPKFPIDVNAISEYVDSITHVIKEKSCILLQEEGIIEETNLPATMNQIQKAMQQLTDTTNIHINMVDRKKNEKTDDSQRFFLKIEQFYQDFNNGLSNLTQMSAEDHDFHANIIRTRITNRESYLKFIRGRFIPYYQRPNISIFADAVMIYEAMDRVLWCGKNNFSWQLSLFHLYYNIIIGEFRMFLMDLSDYTILSCYFQDTVETDFTWKKNYILFYVKEYISALKWAMSISRKNIYQCPPKILIKGDTYIEFTNTCISGGPTMQVCNKDTSPAELSHLIETEHHNNVLSDTGNSCPRKILIKITFEKSNLSPIPRYTSEMCVRTCPNNDFTSEALRTISFMEQTSDIENNMVVTNVRFVEENDIIQIQIEEGQLDKLNSYMIHDKRNWKVLPQLKKTYDVKTKSLKFYIDGNIPGQMIFLIEGVDYTHIDPNHKTLYLDNVILPSGYIVTGVRLRTSEDSVGHGKSFELQVRATLYNVHTNELIVSDGNAATSFWMTPKMMKPMLPGYNRPRIKYEGDMIGSYHSSVVNTVLLNSQPNQYLDFARSELMIRGEQKTVPFFDARPTFAEPPLPLGGIGLFLTGSRRGEAYITFDTFPYPVSQIMNL